MKTPTLPMGINRSWLVQLLLFSFLSLFQANQINGQSLFEVAVSLDSLYKRISDSDLSSDLRKKAAESFFEKLENLYALSGNTDRADLNRAFSNNQYLSNKVELAFNELKLNQNKVDQALKQLEAERSNLYRQAIAEIDKICAPLNPTLLSQKNGVKCNLREERLALNADQSFANLSAVVDNCNSSALLPLKNSLMRILGDINEKNIAISNIQPTTKSIFQLSSKANGGLPLRTSTAATSSISKIIIQNNESSSLQGSLIDGASKWIAERMREELSIAFFDRFEEWMDGQNISQIFPHTLTALRSSENTDYSLLIQIFKSAFAKDLREISFNILNFIELETNFKINLEGIEEQLFIVNYHLEQLEYNYSQLIRKYEISDEQLLSLNNNSGSTVSDIKTKKKGLVKELKDYQEKIETIKKQLSTILELQEEKHKVLKFLLFAGKAMSRLKDGEHPVALLSYLSEQSDQLFPGAHNLKPSLILLDEISKSLVAVDNDKKTVWLKNDILAKLSRNVQLRDFYFGLVYQAILQRLLGEKKELEINWNNLVETNLLKTKEGLELSQNLSELKKLSKEFLTIYDTDLFRQFLVPNSPTLENSKIEDNIDGFLSTHKLISRRENPTKRQLSEDVCRAAYDYAYENLKIDLPEIDNDVKILYELLLEFENNDFKSELQAIDDKVNWSSGLSVDLRLEFEKAVEHLSKKLEAQNLQKVILFSTGYKDSLFIEINKILVGKVNQQVALEVELLIKDKIKKYEDLVRVFITFHSVLLKAYTYAESQVNTNIIEPYRQKEIKRLIYEDPEQKELRRLWMAIKRIDASQAFIDNLLVFGNKRQFGDIVNGFFQFASRTDALSADLENLRKAGKANLGSKDFIFLIKNSLDALEQVYNIALPNDPATVNTVIGFSHNLLDAYTAVLDKDFDAVVMNVFPVVDSIIAQNYSRKIELVELTKRYYAIHKKITVLDSNDPTAKSWQDLFNAIGIDKVRAKHFADYNKRKEELKDKKTWQGLFEALKIDSTTAKQLVSYNKQQEELKKEALDKRRKLNEVFRYSAFLAAVVESKNSEEIKNAIQAIALPAGSFNIKRRSISNISLNAYPGLTAGAEYAYNSLNRDWGGNVGFTAPIGLSFNWGRKKEIDYEQYANNRAYRRSVDENRLRYEEDYFLKGASNSLFFPLIDLGALVLFRLDNPDEVLPVDVGFQQVFSPGIIYVRGFRNSPLSLMIGGQLSPQLRRIDEKSANALRFNMSLVIDLPMANIRTRGRLDKKRQKFKYKTKKKKVDKTR